MEKSMEERIIGRFGKLSPNRILREIVESPGRCKEYTFVVCGRCGPTGKTWLSTGLQEYGFNAIELSAMCNHLVEYLDNKNHIIENHVSKAVVIMLNERFN